MFCIHIYNLSLTKATATAKRHAASIPMSVLLTDP